MRKITSNGSKLCMKVNNLNLTFLKLKLTPYILIFFFFFSFFFSFSVLQILAVGNPRKFTIEDRENRTDLIIQHDHVVLGFTNGYELELLVFLKHFLIIVIMMIKLWINTSGSVSLSNTFESVSYLLVIFGLN